MSTLGNPDLQAEVPGEPDRVVGAVRLAPGETQRIDTALSERAGRLQEPHRNASTGWRRCDGRCRRGG